MLHSGNTKYGFYNPSLNLTLDGLPMLSTAPSLELHGAEPDQTTLLGLFVEHSPAAIAMFDRNLRYLLASRQWREDHGFGDRGVRGHCHGDFAVVSEQAK